MAAEQDSYNLAMLLLENANITSAVYSTSITQMVAHASTCHNDANENIYLISKGTLQAMVEKASATVGTPHTIESESPDLSNNVLSTYQSNARDIVYLTSKEIRNNERHENEDRTSFRVTLDYEMETLADIKVDDESHENSDGAKLKVVGAMMAKRKFQEDNVGNGFSRNTSNKTRIPNGEGPKANSKCRACGTKSLVQNTQNAFTI